LRFRKTTSQGGNNNADAAITGPAAAAVPIFRFNPGFPTGGGGNGFANGAGVTEGSISVSEQSLLMKHALPRQRFGFSLGSGFAVNSGNEYAGGNGGANALVRGMSPELDDIGTALYQIPLPKKVEHQDYYNPPFSCGHDLGQFP
jgi:hypothetical protein